jgi:hypothetical protein
MEAQNLVNELLFEKTKEEAIQSLQKDIQNLNNEFTIFGYTSEDLRKMKTKKEALKIITNG